MPTQRWPQVFATLLLLNKSRRASDIRWVILRVVLEFLQLFRVIFNTTSHAWSIDKSVWAFQAIRWVLIKGLMLGKGYAAYIKVGTLRCCPAAHAHTCFANAHNPPSTRAIGRPPSNAIQHVCTTALLRPGGHHPGVSCTVGIAGHCVEEG